MSNLHPLMEQILKANMNPPMTPIDQTLVDQMKTALSKSAPDVTQNIHPLFRPILDAFAPRPKAELNNMVRVVFDGKDIILIADTTNPQTILIDSQAFQALERFAERIGWRPQ